jgi:predicted nucleic acid-binding Zn finger protein
VCKSLHSVDASLAYFLTNWLLYKAFSAFGEKGKFLVSNGNDASVKIPDLVQTIFFLNKQQCWIGVGYWCE